MITLSEVVNAVSDSGYAVIDHRGSQFRHVFVGDRHGHNYGETIHFLKKLGSAVSTIYLEGTRGTVVRNSDGFRLEAGIFTTRFGGDFCPNDLVAALLGRDSQFFREFLERGGRILCNDNPWLVNRLAKKWSNLWLESGLKLHGYDNDYDRLIAEGMAIARERSKCMIKALRRDRSPLSVQVVGADHLDAFWRSQFDAYVIVGRAENFKDREAGRDAH